MSEILRQKTAHNQSINRFIEMEYKLNGSEEKFKKN